MSPPASSQGLAQPPVTGGRTVRAFVAIELPEKARALLLKAQDILRSEPGRETVKWVGAGGIHLTLRFLGDVPVEVVPALAEALNRAVVHQAPFTLQTAELGAFPSVARPRVIWIGVGGDIVPLKQLKQALDYELRPLGFPPEERPFSPHLTLGRVRPTASPFETRQLGAAVRSAEWVEVAHFMARALTLMRSDLTSAGAVHTPLAVAPLPR